VRIVPLFHADILGGADVENALSFARLGRTTRDPFLHGFFVMGAYPTRYRLPVSYTTDIGRVVTRFAYLEAYLRRIVYGLVEVGPKIGRVTIRNPRIEDSFTIIQDVMGLRSFATTIDLALLRTECKKIEKFRDRISHGVWVKHPKSKAPILQVTAGSYSETPGGKSIKARIRPKAQAITPENFKSFLRGIETALALIENLAREIDRQRHAERRGQMRALRQKFVKRRKKS
jgi:hypothetical protein